MKLVIAFSIAFLSVVSGQRNHSIISPKAFRIGAIENVILNLHGYSEATVSAYLQDLPNRQNVFSAFPDTILSGEAINRPIIIPCQVKSENILEIRNRQQVLLVVRVTQSDEDFSEEYEVLVSKEAGYLFVRTARPIYRPGEKVFIQVAPLGQVMAPDSNTIVTVTVKTPDGVGVFRRNSRLPADNFLEFQYDIAELPMIGVWFVEAAYTSKGFETKSESQFQVDRYVLPVFNVEVKLHEPFLLPFSQGIFGNIIANDSLGQPVFGSYFLRMKFKRTPDSDSIEFHRIPGRLFTTARITKGIEPIEVPIQRLTQELNEGESIQTLIDGKGSITVEVVVYAIRPTTALEAAISPEIPFLASPFQIDISRTSLYYTPRLSYQLRADIQNALTEAPLSQIPVTIRVTENGATTSFNTSSNARGEVNSPINFIGSGLKVIEIATISTDHPAESQISRRIDLNPYVTPGGKYLQIRGGRQVASVGEGNYFFTFLYNRDLAPDQIRYSVVARGTVVLSGTNKPNNNSFESTQIIPITQDMVPNARVVAYYFSGSEVVSNSFWFDVVNQCNTPLTVIVPEQVRPGSNLTFQVQGEPNAIVGVGAVDREAYLFFNETRLTRDTMFDAMGAYDQGCDRNGGNDTRNVYLNAGLVISTGTLTSSLVESLECNPPIARKRRSASEEASEKRTRKLTDTELQRQSESFLQKCDRDGRFLSFTFESCRTRETRVRLEYEANFPGCSNKFKDACLNATNERFLNEQSLHGGIRRSSPKHSISILAAEGVLALAQRKVNFRENLLFSSKKLDNTGMATFATRAADSITTFEVDTISMADSSNGFCVSDTEKLLIFQNISVQINLPFSVKIREQAILKMTLLNHSPTSHSRFLTIRVKTSEKLCSKFNNAITSDTAILASNIKIDGNSDLAFAFAIFPLSIPQGRKATITVQVADRSPGRGLQLPRVLHEITREILIEEAGVLRETYQSVALDVNDGNPQETQFVFAFPENYISGTRQCTIYAYTNFLGPSLDVNAITGEPMRIEDIFRRPYGCGEQNMLVCGPNVYTHMYLETTGKLTPAIQPQYNASIKRMEDCYASELCWRSTLTNPTRRAFAVWDNKPPSLWLNAYVVKVFARAKDYFVDLNIDPLCSALQWMIGEQDAQGFFHERYHTHHREMKGAVQGRRTLAAYTLIALEESLDVCPNISVEVATATTNVMNYLVANKDHDTFVDRPYSLALLSYALALDNPNGDDSTEINARLLALHQVTPDNREVFWRVRRDGDIEGTDLNPYWYRRPQAIDVEATAYALLAQIQIARNRDVGQEDLDFMRKIVHWLVGQRNEGGAFISTQDTVIGLQALATYEIYLSSLNPQQEPTNLTITFTGGALSAWAPGSEPTFVLDDSNANFKEVMEVPSSVINGIAVNVSVQGHGEGVLSYRCTYKTLVEEEGCHFTVHPTVTLKLANVGEPQILNVYTLEVEIAKSQGSVAEQSVVEIGLMTGFIPDERTADRLSMENVVDGVAQRCDITDHSVVLYFNNIDAVGVRFAIDLIQTLEDVLPQPAEIKVFDYYEPSVQCSHFYSLPTNLPPLFPTTNCDGTDPEICSCAEGGCTRCRTRDQQFAETVCLNNGNANCSICENENCENSFAEACGRNYVYLVFVEEVTRENDIFVKFTATIENVMKKGDDTSVEANSTATFMMRTDCFSACVDNRLSEGTDYIRPGQELIIMGQTIDVSLDRNGNKLYIHQLDDRGLLERFISFDTCDRRRNFVNKNCQGDLSNASDRERDRCKRQGQFVEACNSYLALVDKLMGGCEQLERRKV